jgi:DNA integrity scanning protein DisA with diadenylate cyclase activity
LDTVEIGQVHATVPLMRHLWDYGQNLLSILRVFVPILDILLVLLLIYAMLVVIGERRTLWMVRGFILLLLAASLSQQTGLVLLAFVLDKLVVGAAVAMAFILQGEFRRLLERLGRGQVLQLLTITQREPPPHPDSVLDELVDAIKELSQNRIGALIILRRVSPSMSGRSRCQGCASTLRCRRNYSRLFFKPVRYSMMGRFWCGGRGCWRRG